MRAFDSDEVVHVDDSVDPIRDLETIQVWLMGGSMWPLCRRHDCTTKQPTTHRTCPSACPCLYRLPATRSPHPHPTRAPPPQMELCKKDLAFVEAAEEREHRDVKKSQVGGWVQGWGGRGTLGRSSGGSRRRGPVDLHTCV